MIPLETFLAAVDRSAARVTEYCLGGDGTNGKCDCIGLIIGAVRLCGEEWPGLHGSNYTARNQLADGIHKDEQLRLGDLVFKGRQPNDSGYALPDKYKSSGDLTDYYHVGVVTSADPLRITHCTAVPGAVRHDSTRGKWHYSGRLKLVEEGGDVPMQTAIVAAPSGKTVNLRKEASAHSAILCAVPVGAEVYVPDWNAAPDWARVTFGQDAGYMKTEFLTPQDEKSRLVALLEQALALAKKMEA